MVDILFTSISSIISWPKRTPLWSDHFKNLYKESGCAVSPACPEDARREPSGAGRVNQGLTAKYR
jgi:hypothetical protein